MIRVLAGFRITIFVGKSSLQTSLFALLHLRQYLYLLQSKAAEQCSQKGISAMETEYNNQLLSVIIINGQALTSTAVHVFARHYAHVLIGRECISQLLAHQPVIVTMSAEIQKVYGI